LSLWSIDLLVRFGPQDVPRLETTTVDWNIFLFLLAVSSATGVLFGLLPALRASRSHLERALNEASRGGQLYAGKDRSRSTLVTAEVAIALVLLVGAGLTVRSFYALSEVDPGFDQNNLLTMHLLLPDARYDEGEKQTAFVRNMMDELRAAPGLRSASVISPLPLGGNNWRLSIELQDRPASSGDARLGANWRTVTPGYFKTMGIPLLRGRDFNDSDILRPEEGREAGRGLSVLVVNESFARRYYPNEEPLGKFVRVGYDNILCEIVGIVGDVRHRSLGTESGEEMYTLYYATPWPSFDLAVRTAAAPMASIGVVREAIWRVDEEQPVGDVYDMPELLRGSMATDRFLMALMASFAAIALLLAASGIYGVISFTVVQRTREIGIRVALGARGSEVIRLILEEGTGVVLSGIALGLVAAFALSRFLSSELYGVSASDPLTYVSVAVVLLAVAFIATLVPARRASRVDPLVALRHE
jgi:predicted permease